MTSRIVSLEGMPPEQRVVEYCVGSAQNRFVFPGIMQCITITGWTVGGMVGTHISPGASKEEIDDTFARLNTGGGKTIQHWYIVGNFDQHAQHTKVGWTSASKIGKSARKALNKSGTYLARNTSPESAQFSWGINVYADHGPGGITFAYSKSGRGQQTETGLGTEFTRV